MNIQTTLIQIDNTIIFQIKGKVRSVACKGIVFQTFLKIIEKCQSEKLRTTRNRLLTLKNFFLKKSNNWITFSLMFMNNYL
jgi:hypothetical protein